MRSIYFLLLILGLSFSASNATIHMVEVGGNQNTTPYYAPQFITIQVGDTVQWNFVSGTHNCVSQSGPTSFNSGDLSSGATYQYVFNVVGIYEYECTRFNHALTQFGTITVEAVPLGIAEVELSASVGPNPATDFLRVRLESGSSEVQYTVVSPATGQIVLAGKYTGSELKLDVSALAAGPYLLQLVADEQRMVRRLVIQ